MSKQISFPQHMRNAQAALDVLAAECKKYDPAGRDWYVEIAKYNSCDVEIMAYNDYMDEACPYVAKQGSILEDAATALLHTIAGTEEAPF